jgi:hypothetical protein
MKVAEATFQPGMAVTWLYRQRGGYCLCVPVKAEVVRVTARRVIVRVTKERTGEVVERSVKAEYLRAKE